MANSDKPPHYYCCHLNEMECVRHCTRRYYLRPLCCKNILPPCQHTRCLNVKLREMTHGCKRCSNKVVVHKQCTCKCMCFENGRKEAMKDQSPTEETAQNAIQENESNQ